MTSEQTPDSQDSGQEPRPGLLTVAAALTALEGVALLVGGVYLLVKGVAGHPADRQTAVSTGVTLLVIAGLPLVSVRGLLRLRRWSRGPACVTQILALPVAWDLLQADSLLIPGGIVLAVVAVAALVLLLNPATTKALGLRGWAERS